MGMLDKLKFWEKKDDDEFEMKPDLGGPMPGESAPGALPGEGYGLGPEPGRPGAMASDLPQQQGLENLSGFPEPRVTPAHEPRAQVNPAKEMEVINLKLDSIRSSLENINIRLERIEKLARGDSHETKTW